jgi:hypothetical protein
MSLQNPQGITGPSSSGNYVQSDYRNPTISANVASYPTGYDSLNVTWPIPVYAQSGTGNPPAPVSGQLANSPLGFCKNVYADGSSKST